MGYIAFYSGISFAGSMTAQNKFFGAGYEAAWPMATVAACAIFGAVCGAGDRGLRQTMAYHRPFRKMKRYGYGAELATGSVSGGEVGPGAH